MKTIFKLAVCFAVLFSSCKSSGDGWVELFNGEDFTGFIQLNGKAPYRVEDGMLVGTSVKGQPNSFMVTEQDYDDFILEFDVLCASALNSGVQFRSESRPDYKSGRVHGYQCEIDPSDRAWSGGIYDEARRGWLVTLQGYEPGRSAYKKDDWNNYRIEAFGDTIRVWLNGVNTANLLDNTTLKGFIAFQVHGIGNNDALEGKEIKWKNIRILTDNIRQHLLQGALATEVNRIPNVLSSTEQTDGWKLLFDGRSNVGWRGAHKEAFPQNGWKIADGAITVLRTDGRESAHGGDIVTLDEYSAFELSLEFKITEGANSGIKYFVTESEKQKGSAFGLEYQVLDDAVHPDAKLYTSVPGSRACAGLYDLIKPQNIRFNGVGQWNQAVIKVFPNNHVEHWLNGFKTVEYERGSEDFRKLVKGSKYAAKVYNENDRFGEAPKGHILLQDHGDEVSFRSIKIKELK
ncbi:MAG: DUF1080 domain-containing protein [Tannerella sp.]|jgi:hypothetical protein|nr:DUF1080 domain-containing protein [Tannerella sp.]